MGDQQVQYCPICRKTVLEPEQILCPKCKADNPYNLLGGMSPTMNIHEELNKIGEYKDEIAGLHKRLKVFGRVIIILILTIAALAAVNLFV